MSHRPTLGLLATSVRRTLSVLAVITLVLCAMYHLAQPKLDSINMPASPDTGYSTLLWLVIASGAVLSLFFLIGKPQGGTHDSNAHRR